jgi:hypothetical protein
VNGSVKVYADELYESVRSASGQTANAEKKDFAHDRALRRSSAHLPLSGPEFQKLAKIYADHVSRCMRARFDSYRRSYSERQITPNDQELREILNDVMAAKDQETKHSATALHQYAQANGLTTGSRPGFDPAAIIAGFAAAEHERVVNDWRVWKAEINLKQDAAQQNQPAPKSGWKAVGGLAWSWGAVVVIAGIFFSFLPNAVYAGDVIGTVVFCTLGFGVLATKLLTWERTRNLRFRGAANAVAITAATILLAALVTWAKQRVPQPASIPLITMQISPTSLPISIPPHTITSVLQLHPYIGLTGDRDGLFKITNDTGREGCWPTKAELDTTEPNRHEDIYRVEISNHSDRILERGRVKFALKYNAGMKGGGCMKPSSTQPDQNDLVLLPPLDPGKSFEFYAINQSNFCAWLLPPESATVKMAGRESEVEVPLIFDKNPFYDAGAPVFSQTAIKWVGVPTHPGGYGMIRTAAFSCETTARTAPAASTGKPQP